MNYRFLIKATWILFGVFLFCIVLHVLAIRYNFLHLSGDLPNLQILENPRSELASELYSEDGILLGKYFRENRSPVEYEEISPNIIKALLATEDIRFEDHSGIDMKGIFAITWYLLIGESRGSSTISQQLAKILFRTRSGLYEGPLTEVKGLGKVIVKTKEWITAIKIEQSYTKKEIITMYLNTADFGSNAFGIKVAGKTFFGIAPDKINKTQAALLVGLLKSPSLYSPIINPEKSKNRRNTVLHQMEKYNFITAEEEIKLKQEPLKLNYNVENQNQGIATYFRTVVNNYLVAWCKKRGYDLYTDGLKIYTTIDSKLQAFAEKAVSNQMRYIQKQFYIHWKGRNPWVDESLREIPGFIQSAMKRTDAYRDLSRQYNNSDSIYYYLNKKKKMRIFSWQGEKDTLFSSFDSLIYYKKFLQSGLMSMDPETGHIKAWVGGINHKFFKYDHVKQSKRQPGSTFKPIIYCAAMDNGYSPCYKVQDVPVSFYLEESGTTYTPQNSDGPSTGEYLTLRQALAKSINTVTAFLMKKLTPQTVVDYAKKLGFKGNIEPVPALCYGISDVSIFELAGAYSTFANKGIYTEPFFIVKVEDKNGNIIEEFVPKKEEALNEETAYTMLYMLKGATEEKGGTALGLHRYPNIWGGNDIGAKTGTTQNYSDGWFVGVTQKLVTAVWVGGDDRCIHFRDWTFGQGAKLALPIWGEYMNQVYSDPSSDFKKCYFNKPSQYSVETDCKKYNNSSRTDSTNIFKPKNEGLNGI